MTLVATPSSAMTTGPVGGIVHGSVDLAGAERGHLGKADAFQRDILLGEAAPQQPAERHIRRAKRAGDADALAAEISRLLDAGLYLGEDNDRKTGVPVRHVAHGQSLGATQHHLVAAPDL